MNKLSSILIVDDDKLDRLEYKRLIKKAAGTGFEFEEAATIAEAVEHLKKNLPDAILLDFNLPGGCGLDLLDSDVLKDQLIPVVLLTGEGNEYVAAESIRRGAHDYLRKDDLSPERLYKAIEAAREKVAFQNALKERDKALRQALKEAEEARQAAQRADQAKSMFLSNMSHEIRTPLTSIIGFSEALQTKELSGVQEEDAIKTVLSNGKHLLQVINDILDFSKIEAGELLVESTTCDILTLLEDVRSTFSKKADDKGIELKIELKDPIPDTIMSDALRLKQILFNLIGNAIKFTTKGAVTLAIGYSEKNSALSFDVIDTGIGIPKESEEKLFKAFSQADASTTREFGGTGLGLIISAQLADRLGGDITFKSEEGVGSTFTLTIKATIPESAVSIDILEVSRKASPTESLSNSQFKGTVLYADDCPHNRALMQLFLEKLGLIVHLACDGMQALQKTESIDFDLLLLDMQMPVLDGLETATRLRERFPSHPIVAVTASVLDTAISDCYAAGCNDFLRKPFLLSELRAMLRRHLPEGEAVKSDKNSREIEREESPSKDLDDAFSLIVNNFLSGLTEKVKNIENAYQGENYKELEIVAHKLAGAGLFGFEYLGELASLLEAFAQQAMKDRESIDPLELLLRRLKIHTASLLEEHLLIDENQVNRLEALVVDANESNRKLISQIVEKLNISVTEAAHSEDALKMISEKPFDIALIDLELPLMNGCELAKELRSLSELQQIPILALTTQADADVRPRCLDAGFSDIATKPLNATSLRAKIRELTQEASSSN